MNLKPAEEWEREYDEHTSFDILLFITFVRRIQADATRACANEIGNYGFQCSEKSWRMAAHAFRVSLEREADKLDPQKEKV